MTYNVRISNKAFGTEIISYFIPTTASQLIFFARKALVMIRSLRVSKVLSSVRIFCWLALKFVRGIYRAIFWYFLRFSIALILFEWSGEKSEGAISIRRKSELKMPKSRIALTVSSSDK